MINFLSPILQPSVHSDGILDDDYLPDNLISDNVQKANMGFMAYCVVKPPINLDFELMCHADIRCIKIWTKVHSLKTTGLDIFVKNGNDKEYTKVGSCNNLPNDGAIFVQQNCDMSEVNVPPNLDQFQFFRSSVRATRHAKSIRIRIVNTARCVPVLRRIEIIGYVSRTESRDNKQLVNELMSRTTRIDDAAREENGSSDEESSSERSRLMNSSVNVPEEFLDSITCDIMAMPMILPSGKVIDRLTLEKHNQHEERWGRLPSDPYTGQCFTTERKTVFNAALKAQIDKFLLDHSEAVEFQQTARTVGHITRSATVTAKRPLRDDEHPTACTSSMPRPLDASNKRARCETAKQLPNEASGTSSLDEALKLALRNITRYTIKTETKAQTDDKCSRCNCTVSDMVIFYKIKICSHFICKKCLDNGQIGTCDNCGIKFSNVDIERFHKSMF